MIFLWYFVFFPLYFRVLASHFSSFVTYIDFPIYKKAPPIRGKSE